MSDSMSKLDIILQIQIENKAYYLKTKILFMKTKHIVIFDLSRREQKNLRKSGNCRAPSEAEAPIFCRQIPSRFRMLISFDLRNRVGSLAY